MMQVGMWGLTFIALLAALGLYGFILAIFQLCDALTERAHRLLPG